MSHPEEVGGMDSAEVWRHGDRMAAISDLFEAHHRRLVGLARLLVDDQETAEEVVQEAFLALYRQWRVLRDTSAPLAYLNRCVVNGGRKRLRRRILLASATSRVAPTVTVIDSAEQDAVVHDEVDRVRRQIRALAGRQREVLVLRYYLDQSEAEIAETLGISRGSVKSHASRGLAALARRLDMES